MKFFRAYEYDDPSVHVEFSRTEHLRNRFGCAVCKDRAHRFANKCKPIKGKPYCRKFELERGK